MPSAELTAPHEVHVSIYDDLPHLAGMAVPVGVKLSFVSGAREDMASFARKGPLVIHTFPGIEWWTDAPQVADEDTAQAVDFREHASELADLGYRILGITTQPVGELHQWARREGIRYFLASDPELQLADALALPARRHERLRRYRRPRYEGLRVYQRLMLIVRDGRIRKVFYPVKEPNHAAEQVLSWLYQSKRGR
jgi:peroxiredoxin